MSLTILDMQTDASATLMDALYMPVKIGDDQPYYWSVFTGIAHLPSTGKIIYFFRVILKFMNWIT